MTIALDNVVAVVTGAAGGIGRATVQAMKDAHATVIATDIGDNPGDIGAEHYLRHDVTSEADWKAVAALAQERYGRIRSEEHTSELQSLMRISYAVFCLKKKKKTT